MRYTGTELVLMADPWLRDHYYKPLGPDTLKQLLELKRDQKMQKIKLVPPIEGFEEMAELRLARHGESLIGDDGLPEVAEGDYGCIKSIVLTKRMTLADRLGLEVGATYSFSGDYALIFVQTAETLVELGFHINKSGCSSERFLRTEDLRMVIRPDGTFVDDEPDGNYESIGGVDVSKADLRAYCELTCHVPACWGCGREA